MKQTAVEWCIEKLGLINFGDDSATFFYEQLLKEIKRIGKEMEKQHIIDAHKSATIDAGFEYSAEDWAEQYYNENFTNTEI